MCSTKCSEVAIKQIKLEDIATEKKGFWPTVGDLVIIITLGRVTTCTYIRVYTY